MTTRTRLFLNLLVAAGGAIAFGVASLLAAPGDITFTEFLTGFNNPIGIDFFEDPNDPKGPGGLVVSAGFPTGQPFNLLRIAPGGAQSGFSTLNGLTEELKIASVRTNPACQAFPVGDVFTGTGRPGEIVRVSRDGVLRPPAAFNPGAPLPNGQPGTSWVQLPGEPDLLRGSLYVDRSCAFGGDLIVVTGTSDVRGGGVWRVKPDGTAQLLTLVGSNIHLEGVVTLPNDPRYGPWAGTIITGSENLNRDLQQEGELFSIAPDGSSKVYNLAFTDADGVRHPMKPEDLDLIEAGQAFMGINYQAQRLLSASSIDFAPFVDDVLFTQEYPCGASTALRDCAGLPLGQATTGLYTIRYVGSGGNAGEFNVTPFKFSPESVITSIDQWEHVTLSPFGPHLKVTKTPDNATFKPGDPLSFTIVVTSDGAVPVGSVTLADSLPTVGGLTWSVTSVTPAGTCAIGAGQVMNCALGILHPSEAVTIVVTTTNAGGAPGASCDGSRIINTATATSVDAEPATDTGDFTCTPIPAIDIVKKTNGTDNDTAPGPTVPVGSTVTWTYTVTNTGEEPVAGVQVADDNGTPGNPADDFTATYVSGDTNTNGLLDLTETWAFTASGMAALGQYENVGKVTGQGERSHTTVTDTNVDHYLGVPPTFPNITVKKTGNGPVKLGDAVRFTIVVTNVGPGSATDVKVTDRLPAGLAWTSNQAACTLTTRLMTCNIGTMTQGQVFTVVLTATVAASAFDCECISFVHRHGDHCAHERGARGHRNGDRCEHEKTTRRGVKTMHYGGDGCDHERGRPGHRNGDGCDHDKDTHPVECTIRNTSVVTATNEDPRYLGDNSSTASVALAGPTHHPGDACDHERRKDGHKDGDRCEHEKATHHHYGGDGCDHARRLNGHSAGDGCDHERTVRRDRVRPHHFEGDRCQHDRGDRGHRAGDGCEHERQLHHHYYGDGCDHERGRFGHSDRDGCDHDKEIQHVFDGCIVKRHNGRW